MAQSDHRFETGVVRSSWPSLVWLIFAVVIAITALMLAPVPN